MNLTESDKQRIQEEEEYRKKIQDEEQYRNQLHGDRPKKGGIGMGTILGYFFLFLLPPMIAYYISVNIGYGLLVSLLLVILFIVKSVLKNKKKST